MKSDNERKIPNCDNCANAKYMYIEECFVAYYCKKKRISYLMQNHKECKYYKQRKSKITINIKT